MRNWILFVGKNKRILNFGFLFNLFSSFGQTYLVSLFVPIWLTFFKISNTSFGSIYALVTIISAFFLSFTGKYIDRMTLTRYGTIVFTGLLVSVLILSQANNLVVLMLGLFLVRYFGQGLMTHTSSTGIAKHFNENRGKALGITALGHPAGQFLLPIILLPLIQYAGWSYSLLLLAAIAFILVVPSLWAIKPIAIVAPEKIENKKKSTEKEVNYLSDTSFWIIALNTFVVPFICTAIFLYQYSIGETKGWDKAWVTFSFSFYAVFNAIFLLISGSLVDRFSAKKLFPLYLFPSFVALLLLGLSDQKIVLPIFYALIGVSIGMGSTIKTAVMVEVYGKDNLGKIRSYFTTILVLSTALGPPALGILIDASYSFNIIMLIFAALIFISICISFIIWNKKQSNHF